ncbi:hypothetical protein [Kribbella sp. NPDC004875]|uniref:hypothetical protein n=1 Tax=Kribbella sp. NPDC004875 TaxID=3364107 RepID=UPI00367A05B4
MEYVSRVPRPPLDGLIDDVYYLEGAPRYEQRHRGSRREFTGLTPTRYVEVRRRFLWEHPGHAMDGWPLPAD